MAISIDLRVLAKKLEKSSDDILISASKKSPEVFQKVATAIAAASTLLEDVANDMDDNASFEITPQQLDEIAALASAFDESNDPLLKKQASVLDEILLTIAAPKNAVAASRKVMDDEINRLRAERHKSRGEEYYEEPRKALSAMENRAEQAKAVEQQVKRYIPMEAPLMTRYPPDRPGGQMTRISDGIYQDIITGIIYDYKAGYKTQKGNEVPGGAVENQTRELGDVRDQATSLFETRESLMGRYASDDPVFKKIAHALRSFRDLSPELLNKAIDNAMDAGLSTSQIADVLASEISEKGLLVLAVDEADKKKRQYLKSNIQPLTARESQNEYEKAIDLLTSLKGLVEADPSHAAQWTNMMDDTISALNNSGVHPNHIGLLISEFFPKGHVSKEEKDTVPPPSLQRNQQSSDEIDLTGDTLKASVSRQSLIALVLNSIQELAPHLLKSAIVKARADGLDDKQIKSILSSNFNNKFENKSDEVKVAESILPHLKDLGWNDIIRKHISAMANFGVNKEKIQKIAEKYGSSDIKSLNILYRLLKEAAVPSPVLDLGKLGPENKQEPAGQVSVLDVPDEDLDEGITSEEVPELARNVVETIKAGLANPIEYQKLKLRYKGKELIDAVAYYEAQKFRNNMSDEMFSAFYNMVLELAKAELLAASTQVAKPMPFIPKLKRKEEAVKITPEDDLEGWIAAYYAAADKVEPLFSEGGKLLNKLNELNQKDPKDAEAYFYSILDKVMNENGFVGSHEIHSSGKPYYYIADEMEAAEKRKITYGPFNTKAKEPGLQKMRDESPEAFEERKRKSKIHPVTKTQLELAKVLPKDEKELSTDIPAKNSAKHKFLKWEDYQKIHNIKISEVQAKDLEDKIDERISKDKDKLDEAFKNFVYEGKAVPESINALPDSIRNEVTNMLSRGESSRSVDLFLRNAIIRGFIEKSVDNSEINNKDEVKSQALSLIDSDSLKAAQKYLAEQKVKFVSSSPTFTPPSFKDISNYRYLLVGPQKVNELREFRKLMLSRIIKRNVNAVLDASGFKYPMYDPQEDDNISFNQVNTELSRIMGEEKSKGPFFKKIPTGPDGEKLIPFWNDPSGYWESFVATRNKIRSKYGLGKFDRMSNDQKNEQDDEMVENGYVSPDEQLFGYTTSRQMLRNVDYDNVNAVLPDYGNYKTLFSHPDEYKRAFEASRNEANKDRDYIEFPKEWAEISGNPTDDLSDINIPIGIKQKLLNFALKIPYRRFMEIAEENGLSNDDAKRMLNYVKQSGENIRKNITGMASSGLPFEKMKEEIEERFPNSKIPWNVVEYVYPKLIQQKEDSDKSKEKQNELMSELGFYPPYQIAIGGMGKSNKFSKENPVTFASILNPNRQYGSRDTGASNESLPLEDLVKRTPARNRISKPKWNPQIAPRQPGASSGSVNKLSPFVSKK